MTSREHRPARDAKPEAPGAHIQFAENSIRRVGNLPQEDYDIVTRMICSVLFRAVIIKAGSVNFEKINLWRERSR